MSSQRERTPQELGFAKGREGKQGPEMGRFWKGQGNGFREQKSASRWGSYERLLTNTLILQPELGGGKFTGQETPARSWSRDFWIETKRLELKKDFEPWRERTYEEISQQAKKGGDRAGENTEEGRSGGGEWFRGFFDGGSALSKGKK